MSYVLRFVQSYHPNNRDQFMQWEARFAAMERGRPDLPKGRRSQPLSGSLPANTLVWECEFETLAALHEAAGKLSNDDQHQALCRGQLPFMTAARTEIDEILRCLDKPEPEA